MATSGSVDYNPTASQVIEQAFGLIGVKVAEQALEATEMQDGLDTLNFMMKAWQGQGLHLWSKQEGIIFLDKGKTDYLLGPAGDEAAEFDDYISTTTDVATVATDVVIPVASTTSMAVSDKIGVALDDGTRHWSTISSISAGVSVTIASGLPSAAASGNSVFTFTSLIKRPLRVIGVRRGVFGQDSEIEVRPFSRFDYFNQPNKSSQGTVVNYYYSPQLSNGRFYVWPTSSSINDYIRITYERPIEDIDDKTNTLDIPAEWMQAVIYNLAARLADFYDAPPAKVQSVVSKASVFLENILGFDEEYASLDVKPRFN